MAGEQPVAFVFEWRSAAAAKAWRLAGENEFPLSARRRREQGEPLAYITGTKEFWSLSFAELPWTSSMMM